MVDPHLSKIKRKLLLCFVIISASLAIAALFVMPSLAKPASDATSPDGNPHSPLMASFKTASTHVATPDQTFTYTIHLINTWSETVQAEVVDPLPPEVSYVDGSASAGGVYDAAKRTLTWSGVSVDPGASIPLTFQVTPAVTVHFPKEVLNTALISAGKKPIARSTLVVLVPGNESTVPELAGSSKTASKNFVVPGETFTYTIQLRNTGTTTATADVNDPLPAEVSYVTNSAVPTATFDTNTGTLSWTGIEIAPGGSVSLTFEVTVSAALGDAARIENTATISSGGKSFQRTAWVFAATQPPSPLPILAGSYKKASDHLITPGEKFTYSIRVHNSGRYPTLADVSDPIPSELSYITGTASDGGVYDEATRTLTWQGISAENGRGEFLTFEVTPAMTVSVPTRVTNIATISSASGALQRKVEVWLVPEKKAGDFIPPDVISMTIGDTDVISSPEVTLHISATDNVGVKWMFIQEFVLSTRPMPHWQHRQSSGWVPFQTDFPWTLLDESGTHFVAVWVADAAGNVSHLDSQAIDFASLLLPDTKLPRFGLQPYLVYYDSGVQVQATLTPTLGDPDLYVWYPGSRFMPDQKSTQPLSNTETISFTTPKAGVYLFLVFGVSESQYNLSITPAGGPRIPLDFVSIHPHGGTAPAPYSINADGLSMEPVLSQSGEDPLGVAIAPSSPTSVYLPMVIR